MFHYLRHLTLGYVKTHIVAYFFLFLVFLIGIVVGALAVKTLPDEQKSELISYLRLFFQGITNNDGTHNSMDIVQSALYGNLKAIGLIWLLGFTVIGMPIVFFILFTRGFVIGFTVGFLVNEYLVKGLAFALVSVLPHNFIAVPALITGSVAAVTFSMHIIKSSQRKTGFLPQTLQYTLVCIVCSLFMIIASFIESMISPVFMKMVVTGIFVP